MMTAIGNAELNDLGWVHEHQLDRINFEKLIEMIICVHFVHYDLDHAFPGHAVEDVEDVKE